MRGVGERGHMLMSPREHYIKPYVSTLLTGLEVHKKMIPVIDFNPTNFLVRDYSGIVMELDCFFRQSISTHTKGINPEEISSGHSTSTIDRFGFNNPRIASSFPLPVNQEKHSNNSPF
jgi:hypothetical protein